MPGGTIHAHSLDRRSLLGAALGLGLLAPALAGCSSPFDQIERVLGLKRGPLYVLSGYKETSSGFMSGALNATVDFDLDEHGNVTQRTIDFSDSESAEEASGGIQSATYTYTRDEDGWLTFVESSYTLAVAENSSTSSSSKKNSQKTTTIDSAGADVTYEFNSDGQPCRRTSTPRTKSDDQDDTTDATSETTFEYDQNGIITTVTSTSDDPSDTGGRSTTITDYNEKGFPTRYTDTFTPTKGSKHTSSSTFAYQMDDAGVITEAHVEVTSDQSKSSSSTLGLSSYDDVYTYDDKGNLVQCERTEQIHADVDDNRSSKSKQQVVTRTTTTTYTYALIDDPSPAAVFDSLLLTL